MSGFYVLTYPVARRPHVCEECRHVIPAGVRHERTALKSNLTDWRIIRARLCLPCAGLYGRRAG